MTVPAGGGVLPVDKPVGPTSHDVVARARKALSTRRVGHTGTLDPFASGLLLLVVDGATRLSPYLTGMDKRYRAEARLGVSTDSHDHEGAVTAESEAWREIGEDEVESALVRLRGTILQRPPTFSAKKVAGESAHRRARRGEAVELVPVEVTVHELTLVEFDPPVVRFDALCSSGTYIRALARDLGEALGVGAHLTALRRTAIGSFSVDDAVAVDDLSGGATDRWITPQDALERAGLPAVEVEADGVRRLIHGQAIPAGSAPAVEALAVRDAEGLVAIATWRDGRLHPRKVFRSGS